MKKLFLLAIPAMLLSACANVQTATDGATGNASAEVLYCWKDRLHEANGQLTCNWATTVQEACKESKASDVAKSAVASGPTNNSRCGNGQWLVHVTKK